MSKCNLICERFLRTLSHNYRGSTDNYRRYGYDNTVYNLRVMRTVGRDHNTEDYRKCGYCNIVLLKSVFSFCPCCGSNNTRLSIRHERGGRRNRISKKDAIL